MILVGNQRGGARDLALHLLKDENDHVELYELRGFASPDLRGALHEAYAVSRGTRCQKYLFSLSLNPPQGEQVSTQAFEQAVDAIEQKLGLDGQPRAIVFHEKEGRRHCHSVWSRIDIEEMKAKKLGLYKRKLNECARELYLEHGWDMPEGLRNPLERDPRNFTLEQWQQAKRIGKDPRQIKTDFHACWQASDSRQAFEAALSERGYKLARGDRRGHVGVDMHGEVYSVARMAGIKTRAVRARLGEPDRLPSVAERKDEFAESVTTRLQELHDEEERKRQAIEADAKAKRDKLVQQQRAQRRELLFTHQKREHAEILARQKRFNRGVRGLWDRVTGRHAGIKARNELEAAESVRRDRLERDQQIFGHVQDRRALRAELQNRQRPHLETKRELNRDIEAHSVNLNEARRKALEQLRQERAEKPELSIRRPRGPTLEL